MMESVMDWIEDRATWLVPTAIVALLLLSGYGIYWREQQWQEFAVKHNCVKVGETSPQTSVDSKGNTITTPGTTSYKCDDGIVYTR